MVGRNANKNHHQRRYRGGRFLSLDSLKPGQSGIIQYVGGEGALRRRLLDMGLTPNTRVLVRKVAPMGDPLELYLRNYELTIRKDDAQKIQIMEVVE
ncbi:MAG: FeoA family protein [Eubacteriales bacterium]|nr:FeoA family protein [Eubacteriales bacterium]MDD4583232.1 FeoA family protein [Eubacteriales bacterium]